MPKEELIKQLQTFLRPLFNNYQGDLFELGTLILNTTVNIEADIIKKRNFESTMNIK